MRACETNSPRSGAGRSQARRLDNSPGQARSTATLADVARAAGLHRSTVSQILNNRANCWASEETRRRVHEVVAALGYRPNLSARALRSGKSYVIGLVMPGFQANAIQSRPVGLTEAAARAGYTVALSSHPNDAASEDQVLRRLFDRAVDGLVVYPVDAGPHCELRQLVKRGFPVVTFNGSALLDFETDDVSVDWEAVARAQTQHLLDIGCRRICIANPMPGARINHIRQELACRQIIAAGVEPPTFMPIRYSAHAEIFDPEPAYADILDHVRRHAGHFDAVLAHDSIAALVIRALTEHGCRVPEDVAVIGAGQTMLASYNSLPITSVCTHDDWAGTMAFELLLDRVEGRSGRRFRQLVSQTTLVIRQSTRGFVPPAARR